MPVSRCGKTGAGENWGRGKLGPGGTGSDFFDGRPTNWDEAWKGCRLGPRCAVSLGADGSTTEALTTVHRAANSEGTVSPESSILRPMVSGSCPDDIGDRVGETPRNMSGRSGQYMVPGVGVEPTRGVNPARF